MRVVAINVFDSEMKRPTDAKTNNVVDAKALHVLAESCLRLSPQVAVGPSAVFLEIGACGRLYSEENLCLRVQALLKRLSLRGSLGLSDDPCSALALARFRKKHTDELPVEALSIYGNPFGENKSFANIIDTLKNLGIRRLVDFVSLPYKDVAVRFGKDALGAFDRVHNARHIPWPYFKAEERIIEDRQVDELNQVQELEPLLFLLRGLLDRVVLRLRGQGRLLSSFSVRLQQEKYSTVKSEWREWMLELSFPVGSTFSLLSMLRDRMSLELQREPLEAPVTHIVVEVVRSVQSQGRQTDLFSKKEEELELFHAVVARLTERLGSDKAFMAKSVESYLPERSWQKTWQPEPMKSLKIPLRPLRVLKTPQPLQKLDQFFIHRQKKWKVHEISYPERLAGEWWLNDQERDYFRVKTESGEELWVYTHVGSAEYFLHGIFD